MVVPKQGQKLVLEELHQSHPRASRTKYLACTTVWWPGQCRPGRSREKLL